MGCVPLVAIVLLVIFIQHEFWMKRIREVESRRENDIIHMVSSLSTNAETMLEIHKALREIHHGSNKL